MAITNKGRIRILRGNKSLHSDTYLFPGQPFYDTNTRHLYIGNGNTLNALNANANSIIAANAENVSNKINNKSINDIFESDGITAKAATNVTTQIGGKNITDSFTADGNKWVANNAANVTTSINGVAINTIFDSDGYTVLNALQANHSFTADSAAVSGYADSAGHSNDADYATNAGNADNATNANTANNAINAIQKSNGTFVGFSQDNNGILKIGDIIIPQVKLISSTDITIGYMTGGQEKLYYGTVVNDGKSVLNRKFQLDIEVTSGVIKSVTVSMNRIDNTNNRSNFIITNYAPSANAGGVVVHGVVFNTSDDGTKLYVAGCSAGAGYSGNTWSSSGFVQMTVKKVYEIFE